MGTKWYVVLPEGSNKPFLCTMKDGKFIQENGVTELLHEGEKHEFLEIKPLFFLKKLMQSKRDS